LARRDDEAYQKDTVRSRNEARHREGREEFKELLGYDTIVKIRS
jgi:hypothetical protein